jgi:hypothetical protein
MTILFGIFLISVGWDSVFMCSTISFLLLEVTCFPKIEIILCEKTRNKRPAIKSSPWPLCKPV